VDFHIRPLPERSLKRPLAPADTKGMYEGKSVAVVVPAYNEEKLVTETVRGIPSFVDRILVVDDCSRDATAERAAASDPRVEVIRHEQNAGVGAAIVTGYKRARDLEVDVTCVMAADNQMEPADLATLVGGVASGECDYAKANRLFTGQAWQLIPRYRYLGNAILSFFTKIASGYWQVADSQSGYTAVSLETLRLLDLDRLYARYGFPNDLLVHLNVWNRRVRDYPSRPIYGVGEQSGIRLRKVVPRISWLLLKGFFWRMKEKYVIRDFHPLVLFYLLGMALSGVGFALGLLEVALRLMGNPIPVATIVLVALLVVSGLQLLLFAMWFDMESNKSLTSGTQSGRLELPAGARVVLVYEGTRDGALEAAAATTAAAAGSAREN
jgi:glycosyltransferase involved in cell wall biosynthesis